LRRGVLALDAAEFQRKVAKTQGVQARLCCAVVRVAVKTGSRTTTRTRTTEDGGKHTDKPFVRPFDRLKANSGQAQGMPPQSKAASPPFVPGVRSPLWSARTWPRFPGAGLDPPHGADTNHEHTSHERPYGRTTNGDGGKPSCSPGPRRSPRRPLHSLRGEGRQPPRRLLHRQGPSVQIRTADRNMSDLG
jgi:hypothetical protein